jgi:hypothetical protein
MSNPQIPVARHAAMLAARFATRWVPGRLRALSAAQARASLEQLARDDARGWLNWRHEMPSTAADPHRLAADLFANIMCDSDLDLAARDVSGARTIYVSAFLAEAATAIAAMV